MMAIHQFVHLFIEMWFYWLAFKINILASGHLGLNHHHPAPETHVQFVETQGEKNGCISPLQ